MTPDVINQELKSSVGHVAEIVPVSVTDPGHTCNFIYSISFILFIILLLQVVRTMMVMMMTVTMMMMRCNR